MTDTVTCPLVDWYKIRHCDIPTCKHYTAETQHHCLELDRRKPEGTKQFSDAELNLYKFKNRKISTRLVQMHRKSAVQNVKAILVLRGYIDWIAENFKPLKRYKQADMRLLEQEYPLKIKRLGWQNWMWQYFLDDEIWKKFVQRSEGECKQFSQHLLLGIKLTRYEILVRSIQPKKGKIA